MTTRNLVAVYDDTHQALEGGDTIPVSAVPVSASLGNKLQKNIDGLYLPNNDTTLAEFEYTESTANNGMGYIIPVYMMQIIEESGERHNFNLPTGKIFTKPSTIEATPVTVDSKTFTHAPTLHLEQPTFADRYATDVTLPVYFTDASLAQGKLTLDSKVMVHGAQAAIETLYSTEVDLGSLAGGLPTFSANYGWQDAWSGNYYKETVTVEEGVNTTIFELAIPKPQYVTPTWQERTTDFKGMKQLNAQLMVQMHPRAAATKQGSLEIPVFTVKTFALDGQKLKLTLAQNVYNTTSNQSEEVGTQSVEVELPATTLPIRLYTRNLGSGISARIERNTVTGVQVVRITATVASTLSATPVSWADYPFADTGVIITATGGAACSITSTTGGTVTCSRSGPMQIKLEGRF